MPPKPLNANIKAYLENNCLNKNHPNYSLNMPSYSDKEFERQLGLLKQNKQLTSDDCNYFLLQAAANEKYNIVRILLKFPGINAYVLGVNNTTLLMFAASHKQTWLLEQLLPKADTAYINQTNELGRTALYMACNGNHTECAQILLNNKLCNPAQISVDGTTPLYAACSHGNQRLVEILLPKLTDENIKQPRNDGATCLFTASYHQHFNLVPLILKRIKDINWVNKIFGGKYNATDMAVLNGHQPTIQMLCDLGADLSSYFSDKFSSMVLSYNELRKLSRSKNFHEALTKKNFLLIKKLLTEDINLSAEIFVLNSTNINMVFITICGYGNGDCFSTFMMHPQFKVNMSHDWIEKGLQVACLNDNLAMVKVLCSNKTDWSAEELQAFKKNLDKQTQNIKPDIKNFLANEFDFVFVAPPKPPEKDNNTATINDVNEFYACLKLIRKEDITAESVEPLCQIFDGDLFTKLSTKQKAFFIFTTLFFTVRSYHLPLVNNLLNKLQNLPKQYEVSANLSETLIFACNYPNNQPLIKTLLNAKCLLEININVSIMSADGVPVTALDVAYSNGLYDIAKLLLQHGARTHDTNSNKQALEPLALTGIDLPKPPLSLRYGFC